MPNIEEHLRKAMSEGKFDNLPGKGKPLHLVAENPHADPEWEMAFKILKDSGFALPWIETIREIERDIEAAREDLRRAWEWHQNGLAAGQHSNFIAAEWERAVNTFKDKLAELNKHIRNYNLEVPNARFQRPVLNSTREIQNITGEES